MNFRKVIFAPLMLLTASGIGLLHAQDDRFEDISNPLPKGATPYAVVLPQQSQSAFLPAQSPLDLLNSDSNTTTWSQVNGRLVRRESKLQKTLSKLKAAESSDDKQEAASELREVLSAEYDKRMDKYDSEIEKLEKELQEMRERLSRRRDAKKEMVKLKWQQLLAESEGLGWPGESQRSRITPPIRSMFPAAPARPVAPVARVEEDWTK